ncbi:T9SS type A sorting domain-containing protein [Flavilitoribacter nigricans]|uniref:T9SS type A sorting domain-containing protein n=1 Tax=Flavilitoribacter nigricans TaxID=70997 RepID=UPI0014761378|nr:T9SS type A sorting domain-containing protein [Flavilitoribacter nigricans]
MKNCLDQNLRYLLLGALCLLFSWSTQQQVYAQCSAISSINLAANNPADSDVYFGDGSNAYVIESLEPRDYECFDVVPFLVELEIAADAQCEDYVVELPMQWLCNTTGQGGIGVTAVIDYQINPSSDPGSANLDGDEQIILVNNYPVTDGIPLETPNGSCDFNALFEVSGLDPGDKVIVRIDVLLDCDLTSSPTGNIQANLGTFQNIRIISGVGSNCTCNNLQGGAQTIPWKVGLPECEIACTITKDQDVSCNGGTDGAATVNVTGNFGTVTYAWPGGQSTQSVSNLAAGTYEVTVSDEIVDCSSTCMVTINEPPALSCNASASDATCFGDSDGSISVSGSGGTPPYQYSIDGGTTYQASGTFDNLSAGMYTVTVRDANDCTSTCNATVGQPDALSCDITPSDVSCFGGNDGSISVSGSGGTTPYEYSIDGGTTYQGSGTFNNLSAGMYVVTIRDANGCTTTCDGTVEQPDALSCDATPSDVSCYGGSDGSISVSGSGGTAPYEYSIDGGTTYQASGAFNNLSAGMYTVTVRDANGCTSSCDATVEQPDALSCDATPSDVSCFGGSDGSISVSGSGGTTPYEYSIDGGTTYQASGVFNNLSAGMYTVTIRDANGCTTTCDATVEQPDALSCDATPSDASCFGGSDGSISVSGSGGTAPYEYSIDGGTTYQASGTFDNLSAGMYTVTVRDANGCTSTCDATVDQPDALSCDATPTDASCNGVADGSISVSGSGGTAPYEYSIDGGTTYQASGTFDNLSAGMYTVTVRDANGCTSTCDATVGQPSDLTCDATPSDVSCFGDSDGSISVAGSGGTGPYEYSIDGGTTYQASGTFDNLSAGMYTVTVRDANGCTSTCDTTVDQPDALTCEATPSDVSCFGGSDGSVSVSGSGGTAPYEYSIDGGTTYQGSGVFNNLSAGMYTVTVRDANGCTSTCDATVDQPDALTCDATPSDVSCFDGSDGSISVSGSGGTAPYEYSIDGGTTYQGSGVFNNLSAGMYTVTVRDANGCTSTCDATVDQPDALTCDATPSDVSCFDGSDGSVSVSGSGGTAPYEYSIDGGTTYQASGTFDNLSAGMYTVTVRDANGCTSTCDATVDQPDALTCDATPSDASCNGATDGSISVVGSGGTAPYEYSIDGGTTYQASGTFDNLGAGMYTVTVRDANGCTSTCDATVGQPSDLTCDATPSDVSCFGGADGFISVSGSGGTAPYEYSIDGGTTYQASGTFDNLSAGMYTVTVRDANGCTSTCEATVDQPDALSCDATPSDVSCFDGSDGSISVSGSGGTAPYEYSIDGGTTFQASGTFDNLSAGMYTVTVRDANGCTSTCDATVDQPDALSCDATPSDVSCFDGSDGSISVSGSGGTAPYEYSIDGGATFQASGTFDNLSAGMYTVTVRDANGCTSTCDAAVDQPDALSCDATPSDVSCFDGSDGSISVAGSGGTAPYEYSIDGGTTYQASGTFDNLSAGMYTVTVRDANGCTSTCDATVDQPDALSCDATPSDVSCFDGSDGFISVAGSGGTAPYEYSIDGGMTYQAAGTFDNLSAGMYTVTVRDANGCTSTCDATVDQPDELICTVINDSGENTICLDESISLSVDVTGGTMPYTYAWSSDGSAVFSDATGASTTVSNASEGTEIITVEITDANGCITTCTIEIIFERCVELCTWTPGFWKNHPAEVCGVLGGTVVKERGKRSCTGDSDNIGFYLCGEQYTLSASDISCLFSYSNSTRGRGQKLPLGCSDDVVEIAERFAEFPNGETLLHHILAATLNLIYNGADFGNLDNEYLICVEDTELDIAGIFNATPGVDEAYAISFCPDDFTSASQLSAYIDPLTAFNECNNDCGLPSQIEQGSMVIGADPMATEMLNNNLTVYPNPANDQLNLRFKLDSDQEISIQIADSNGRIFRTNRIEAQQGWNIREIDLSDLTNGMYVIILKDENGVLTKRFVKARN